MTIISTLPYTLTNGTTADATQVQANLNQIVSQTNTNAAAVAGSSSQAFSTAALTVTSTLSVTAQGTFSSGVSVAGAATFSSGIAVTGTVSASNATSGTQQLVPISQADNRYAAIAGSSSQVFSVGSAASGTADAVQAQQLTDGSLPITASSVTSGATGTTQPVNTNSTLLATTAYVDQSFLGSTAQSWQNVAGSRSFGTQYTNSTGRPILVSIFTYITVSAASLQVDLGGAGNIVFSSATAAANAYVSLVFPVRPGETYTVTPTSGTAGSGSWWELR